MIRPPGVPSEPDMPSPEPLPPEPEPGPADPTPSPPGEPITRQEDAVGIVDPRHLSGPAKE